MSGALALVDRDELALLPLLALEGGKGGVSLGHAGKVNAWRVAPLKDATVAKAIRDPKMAVTVVDFGRLNDSDRAVEIPEWHTLSPAPNTTERWANAPKRVDESNTVTGVSAAFSTNGSVTSPANDPLPFDNDNHPFEEAA